MSIVTQAAKFNEQEYDVKIYLDNGAGASDSRKFQINPNAIVALNIEDTLADWVVRGNITIYYDFNITENTSTTTPGELGLIPSYIFRNDGNDVLYINIFPRLDGLGAPIDRKHWELVYRFSIYDMEDIDQPPGAQNAASATIKCKKLYFWDQWYQKMITNTLEYSTAYDNEKTASALRPTSIPDYLRSKPTGVAMKEVISKALGDIGLNIPYQDAVVGTLVGGPQQGDWEDGKTNIFYTAPATNNAYQTLMDIYERHVSTANSGEVLHDHSILYKERGPNEGDPGYFALKPISNFFEKAGKTANSPGEYQIEHFFVQDYTSDGTPGAVRAPYLANQNMQKDTKLANYSLITNYRFVDIPGFTNATQFRTKAVHSVDFTKRTFNIEYFQNSVLNARKLMVDKYINEVFTSGEDRESLFLLTLEKSKKGQNIEPVFSLYGDNNEEKDVIQSAIKRQSDGLHKLLQTGIFQNACIHFRCLGSTNREPGRFIAIDKNEGIEDTTFNNKFYGQWFIINVRHMFEAGMYYNEITAIKVHRFKGLEQGFTDILTDSSSIQSTQSPAVTPSTILTDSPSTQPTQSPAVTPTIINNAPLG
jgi:hypothetical protein